MFVVAVVVLGAGLLGWRPWLSALSASDVPLSVQPSATVPAGSHRVLPSPAPEPRSTFQSPMPSKPAKDLPGTARASNKPRADTNVPRQHGRRGTSMPSSDVKPRTKAPSAIDGRVGNLTGSKCDELFPPNKPKMAMRNQACRDARLLRSCPSGHGRPSNAAIGTRSPGPRR